MRRLDYKRRKGGMAYLRSELKILRYVFTKATLRFHARNDYRLSTVRCLQYFTQSTEIQDQQKKREKTNRRIRAKRNWGENVPRPSVKIKWRIHWRNWRNRLESGDTLAVTLNCDFIAGWKIRLQRAQMWLCYSTGFQWSNHICDNSEVSIS